MLPGRYDIELHAGASFNLVITYDDVNGQPMDLTAFTGQMQIRNNRGELLHELTTENAGITLNNGNGNIVLAIPANITIGLDDSVYDLFIHSGEQSDCVIKGSVKVHKAVTR